MVILSIASMVCFALNAVEIQYPNQTWVIRSVSRVNQNGDVAIMVGPPSETFKMKAPIPWETYAVALKYHESNKEVHLVAESKGTQNLSWRNRNGKQSLTAITAPMEPDVSQRLDISFGDEGYEVQQITLPEDAVPYDLSWNSDGTVLVLALTRFPTAQLSLLESYLAVYFDDSVAPLHVKFSHSPKMIVWRDSSSFYAQSGETIYIVDINNEPIEPKPIINRPGITFHSYDKGILIYSDGNDLFVHESIVYTFQGGQRYVHFDYPCLAFQDGNTSVVMDIRGNIKKSLPLQQDDVLIGLNTAQETIYFRRGLTAIEKRYYLNDKKSETIFNISDIYSDYSSLAIRQEKMNKTGTLFDKNEIDDIEKN